MNLRQEARGRECQIRLPVICNDEPETTVLAHFRLAGTCGTGIKPPDTNGAWACSACHDIVDGRRKFEGNAADYIRLMHAEGVMRTLAILADEGYKLTKGK